MSIRVIHIRGEEWRYAVDGSAAVVTVIAPDGRKASAGFDELLGITYDELQKHWEFNRRRKHGGPFYYKFAIGPGVVKSWVEANGDAFKAAPLPVASKSKRRGRQLPTFR